MSTGNPSCLRFSLEESVWFQRGQEVAELLSISLDPDITIQENDQYVTIKGSLALSGEYKCADQDGVEAEEPMAAVRLVQSVTEREEEGSLEFLHRFPVDITIPQNRIESIYDIDIAVESFDYDLPERGSLKLSAELAITGLYGDQQHGSGEEDEAEEAEAFEEEEAEREELEQVNLEPLFKEEKEEQVNLEPLFKEDKEEQVNLEPLFKEDKEEQVNLEPLFRVKEDKEEEEEIPDYAAFAFKPREELPVSTAEEELDSLFQPFSAEAKREPEAQKEEEEEIAETVFAHKPEPAPSAQTQKEPEQPEQELAIKRKEPEMKSPAVKPVDSPVVVTPAESPAAVKPTEPPAAVTPAESPTAVAPAEPALPPAKLVQQTPEPVSLEELESPEAPAEPVQETEKKMIINQKAQQNEEESSSSSYEEEAKAKGKKGSKKKGLSIAEFLARKEDVQVAKIRVCIVQQEDTLERIAERYEVSVQQLLNVNHLGIDQEIAEGQVLYVPAAMQVKGRS